MSNDYFTNSNPLVRQTVAKVAPVNAIFTAIQAAFGFLPAKIKTDTGSVTYAADTGVADAYVVTLPQNPDAYVDGFTIDMVVANTNTGACTVNANSIGVKSVKNANGTDPIAGDLTAGDFISMKYDGTNFVIVSPVRSIFNGTAAMSDAEIKAANERNDDTNAFTDAEKTKLTGVESGATADQTAVQIKSAYESNSNTNAYNDASKQKVDHISVASAVDLAIIQPATPGTTENSKAWTTGANGTTVHPDELQVNCYIEKLVSLSGTTPVVNCHTGNVFTLTTSGNTTFSFNYASVNLDDDDGYGFLLRLTAGGTHTITWPGSVDWSDGVPPDAPANGQTDLLGFYTIDSGTNWIGYVVVDNSA